MDKQQSLFSSSTIKNYAPVLLGVLVFSIVSILVTRAFYPTSADTSIQELNEARVRLETELKDKLTTQEQITKELEEINKTVEQLRNDRTNLTKKIDSTINPSYKPEIEEKKE